MDNNTKNDLLQFCALWEARDKHGNIYFQGSLNNDTKVLVFRNLNKQKPNQPDWNVVLAKRIKEE